MKKTTLIAAAGVVALTVWKPVWIWVVFYWGVLVPALFASAVVVDVVTGDLGNFGKVHDVWVTFVEMRAF